MLDVTDAIRTGVHKKNLLAVRVLNPTHDRIDGIVMGETPRQARVIPYRAGAAYNHGGITGSVESRGPPEHCPPSVCDSGSLHHRHFSESPP